MLTVAMLKDVTQRFAELAGTADMALGVPSCPRWSVEDLVRHIGTVHEWAASAVGGKRNPRLPGSDGVPCDGLPDWYRERAEGLVAAIERAGTAAPVWVFGPSAGDGDTSFWIRRQIHETVMHTWDLRAAHGVVGEVDPPLAWDGVEEVRDVFYPRQVALGRIEPLPGALQLTSTDLDRPTVVLGSGEPVTVALPASDMLLALWHRTTPAVPDGRAKNLFAMALTP